MIIFCFWTKRRCRLLSNSTKTTPPRIKNPKEENWTISQSRRPIKVRIVFRQSSRSCPKKGSAASQETPKTSSTRRNSGSPKFRRPVVLARYPLRLTITRVFSRQILMGFSQVIVRAIRNIMILRPNPPSDPACKRDRT